MKKDFLVIIPARYQSTRFPGKPLAMIAGKSMIHRVWEQCAKVVSSEYVYIATDSEEIERHCVGSGMQVIMTSSSCLTGTDRVYEAAKELGVDLVINVQGDEPLINPSDIQTVVEFAKINHNVVINAMSPIYDISEFESNSVPKVVFRPDGMLMYMSRSPIPSNKNGVFNKAWKQVCIYAFPMSHLEKFALSRRKTPFELEEDIEILRFIELGIGVKMLEVSADSIAVDEPSDIKKVENCLVEKII